MNYKTKYLSHHGVLGMKWGVRRYQRKDGSLTEAGRRRLEGQKEDNTPYKYHKPGEPGIVGLKRKIAAEKKKRIAIGVAKSAAGAALMGASALAIIGKGSAGRALKKISDTAIEGLGDLVGVDAQAWTGLALGGIAGLGLKNVIYGGNDIVNATRDIKRNGAKLR